MFHTAAWARVISDSYGHEPHYLGFFDVDDEPIALVPLIEVASALTGRRAVCLPFSDFSPPLVFGENGWTLVEAELSRLGRERGWKYVEIRGGDGLHLNSCGSIAEYYGHRLNLSDSAEAVAARWSSGAKYAVRQAIHRGLDVATLQTLEAVRQFFDLHIKTRRRHGVPPQPWAFFVNIYKHLIERGLGFVVLARAGANVVAGAVFCAFGSRAIYKFAASDPAYRNSGANNLVLSHAINQLGQSGTRVLDFGRTELANEGLRRFKLSWGADEYTIRYHRFDPNGEKKWSSAGDNTGEWTRHLFRHLPLTVNRAVGAMIYPHLH